MVFTLTIVNMKLYYIFKYSILFMLEVKVFKFKTYYCMSLLRKNNHRILTAVLMNDPKVVCHQT